VSFTISQRGLSKLVDDWLAMGKRVAGPSRVKPDCVLYLPLKSSDQLLLSGFIRPANSIKEFLFPKHDELFRYRTTAEGVGLFEAEPPHIDQLLVAARPCDAASLPILDCVFNWDEPDEFYNRRRKLTTVVTLACEEHDEYCFCTSVGLGPVAERGSDVLLLELGAGEYEVRSLTEKGRTLMEGRLQTSDRQATVPPGPAKRCNPEVARQFVRENFDSPYWQSEGVTCLGCGSCACTCPTCHCFDIVDEGTADAGARVRNWDSCQFSTFTQHASGHNPRENQPSRQRQRISHKFDIYPEKFGEILCTGCGNCSRNCPVGMGVLSVLAEIGNA
jgi:ferredoxin